MQIIFHAGAHATDDERLIKCLLRNKALFYKRGIAVPGPGRYRQLLRDTTVALSKGQASPDAREVLLDMILEEDIDEVDRLLLSEPSFFGSPTSVVANGQIYGRAVKRLQRLADLFRQDQFEIFLALRNPATWLPAVFQSTDETDFDTFLQGADPLELRWSDLLVRIRTALPDIPITVWCNEDTPFVWGQILREVSGVDPSLKISGSFDVLASIMKPEGMKRFRAYLAEHKGLTEMQRRRVISAFLDKFYIEDEVEEALDIPGWTDDLIEEMTEIYEEDVFEIGRIPGVTLIAP